MRKSFFLAVVVTLWVLASGCCVVPNAFPCCRGCDSFRECLRNTVRAPADWCWGNCSVAEHDPAVYQVDGIQDFGGE